MVADPLIPSLVAVMLADPAATAVARPLAFTDATFVFELLHVIERPLNTFPPASWSTATAWVVCPTVSDGAFNVTATDATGAIAGVAVTAEVPLFPSLVAVIVAVPALTAVTLPLDDTVATAVLDDDHDAARPVSVLPFASAIDTDS
jgi:hypothetical protein